MNAQVEIYDATLNNAGRRQGRRLSPTEKVALARSLDEAGVTYVEVGRVAATENGEDWRPFHSLPWRYARMAVRCDLPADPSQDQAVLQRLRESGAQAFTLACSVWPDLSPDDPRRQERLERIARSVAFLKEQPCEVIFDAEHFFDTFRADEDFAFQAVQAAFDGGADTVVLCDTRGRRLSWEVAWITHQVQRRFPDRRLGIHAGNEGYSAETNALAAVEQGARHVQGTINGHGAGRGSADLCWLIPELQVKRGYTCLPNGNLGTLLEVSQMVSALVSQPSYA